MNKDLILSITDTDRQKRLEKIISLITRKYELQEVRAADQFSGLNDLTNIVFPAKDQNNKTTIMAHWDLYPGSLGYNDNSSGVITLLKLQDHIPDNVEMILTDGEEIGGQGCRHYLNSYSMPKQAINIDVVGLAGKIFYETYVMDTTFNIPKSFEYYSHIPFSDSYALEDYGVPNILILTGKNKDTLIADIFHAEHNGINDNKIEMINEDIMNDVFESVLEML